jgi:hypothetical protein
MSNTKNKTSAEYEFQKLVFSKLSPEESLWLSENISLVHKDTFGSKFILAYSLVFRFISKTNPKWTVEDLLFLEKQYPSFSKNEFNRQSLCRAVLMIEVPGENREIILKRLLESCGLKEQEDFFKSLYFLEAPLELQSLAEEGIRTNVENVFDAIALNNPYPTKFLSEGAWNQMVLKAIFMGRPLYKIYDLLERNSLNLALIVNDYIKERWAANREVSPEIWQLLSDYKHPDLEMSLEKAKTSKSELERRAIELVLREPSKEKASKTKAWLELGIEFNQNK